MSDEEKGQLLMLSGALHDIKEKSREQSTVRQLNYIEEAMEKMCGIVKFDNDKIENNA